MAPAERLIEAALLALSVPKCFPSDFSTPSFPPLTRRAELIDAKTCPQEIAKELHQSVSLPFEI